MTELQHSFIGDSAAMFIKNRSLNSYTRFVKLINYV